MLEELVPQCLSDPFTMEIPHSRSRKKVTINWSMVAEKLNRTALECKNKWTGLQSSKLKKGSFTTEEDDIIRKRVAEWTGTKGSERGLWANLQTELGRASTLIGRRWRNVLSVEHKNK